MNMARLLEALPDGPSYHVLQKEFRDVDEAAIKGRPDVARHDHEIEDFSDTAALCANMDLVISVDTSVAHLAGAIGQRTLVMLAWWPDWRWTLQGASTMWYPNMELVVRTGPAIGITCLGRCPLPFRPDVKALKHRKILKRPDTYKEKARARAGLLNV